MKKIIALMVLCTLLCTPMALARGRVWTWEMTNVGGTGGDNIDLQTPVPTSVITTKHKILGIACIGLNTLSSSTEAFVSLSDNVPGVKGGTIAEIIVEAESSSGGLIEWFVYPLSVNTQIIVHQGTDTSVQIYYSR